MNTVPVRLGLMVRPQAPVLHHSFLSATPQQDAGTTLLVSAKGLAGVEDWLKGLRPANWTDLASQVSHSAALEVGNLDQNVIGKLGSSEGEETAKLLRSKWQALKDRADQALSDAPGVIATTWDKMVRFFSDAASAYASPSAAVADLVQFAKGQWQDFSANVVTYSGPVLKNYHEGVNKFNSLKADLSTAKASGQFQPSVIDSQEAKIREIGIALERVRTAFSILSGGPSLDDVAQREFGAYSLGQVQAAAVVPAAAPFVAWTLVIKLAIVVVSISVLVYLFTGAVGSVEKLTGKIWGENPYKPGTEEHDQFEKNKDTWMAGIAAVVGIGILALFLKD